MQGVQDLRSVIDAPAPGFSVESEFIHSYLPSLFLKLAQDKGDVHRVNEFVFPKYSVQESGGADIVHLPANPSGVGVDRIHGLRRKNRVGASGYHAAKIKMYFNDLTSDSNNIKIYACPTNGNYVLQTATQDTPFATNGGWYRVNYAVNSFPSNTNFVKIEMPANTKGSFTPIIWYG